MSFSEIALMAKALRLQEESGLPYSDAYEIVKARVKADLINQAQQSAPTGAPDCIDSPPVRRNTEDLVTTKQIAEAFPPPKHIKPENWQKNLGDAPAWVREARKFSGGPGVSALWNPATFALCMASEKYISKQAAFNIIRREFPGFLDEWEENSSHL